MKKVIVIGATSGIGKALVEVFVERNFKVGITGRRNEKLKEFELTNPLHICTSCFDCTTDNNVEKLNELTKNLGGLDILVLSSGTGNLNEDLDSNIENETNKLNVLAFTEIIDWAYLYFKEQGYGHIVAISSIAGLRGNASAPAYNASKAYQINYLEGIRVKASKDKLPIVVTDIRPGFVKTDMAKGDGMFWVATPKKAASQIYKGILGNRNVVYVTKRWKLIAILFNLLPFTLYKKI